MTAALRLHLDTILRTDERDYDARNTAVYAAVAEARRAGYPAGFRIDPAEPDWPVAYIELPLAGQVSWHLPAHGVEYDGHSTAQKNARVRRYLGRISG
jgi:hypothetical protein